MARKKTTKPPKRAVPRPPPPEPIQWSSPPQSPERFPEEPVEEAVEQPTTEETSEEKAMDEYGQQQQGQGGQHGGGSGGGGGDDKSKIEIKDKKPGNSAKGTAKFVDDEGKDIEVEDPSKIEWHAAPSKGLDMKPNPKDGTATFKAHEGEEGQFQVTASDPESGKSASGTITVKSDKKKSTIEFSPGGDEDEDEDDKKKQHK
jgi:hypothetical protein